MANFEQTMRRLRRKFGAAIFTPDFIHRYRLGFANLEIEGKQSFLKCFEGVK